MATQQFPLTHNKTVIGASIAAIGASALAIFLIPSAVRNILSENFMPHAMCYLYNRQLIALHLGSDAAIWLSYLSISCTLLYLVWRTRREIPFSWMFLAFGLFIVACGFTHFMEMIVLWKPVYWLSGDMKLITAVASVVTAAALPGLVPQIRGMVTAAQLSENRRKQLEDLNTELQEISSRILVAQDTERRRIARELHDGVGQYLAAVKMSCDSAAHHLEDGRARDAILDALNVLERCTKEVRTLSHLLHPPLLDEMGLASAIPWYVNGFVTRSGILVDLNMPSELPRLPDNVELAIFRVLQESLTNVHRHSGSKTAHIQLAQHENQILLTIRDEGRGFDGAKAGPNVGVGIASMRERLREIGGDFSVRSTASGTTVRATIPWMHSMKQEPASPNTPLAHA